VNVAAVSDLSNSGAQRIDAVPLRVEQNGRVRRLTLARPDRRNVLDAALAQSLLRELAEAEADPETGAILLDADGEVFCGGLGLASIVSGEPELPEDIFTFGARARKPIVAAVKGVAISAGLALVANAQVALAAQGSTFGLTDIREGRVYAGLLESVVRAIGVRRTKELALTGRIFSTPEALTWGLVHAVMPAFELDDRALSVTAALADANPDVVRTVLESMARLDSTRGD
jgi:enoyl-CoA hydratase/carnithine racemase